MSVITEVTAAVPVAMEKENTFGEKLLNSSLNGDKEGVMAALAQGGKVAWRNHQGLTPFLAAAQNGHKDICNLLLALGSDVNETLPGSQKTALLQASLGGHKASVEALLSWGAAVDPQDHEGSTPLHVACQEGHLPCVLALLKAGASVTLPRPNGLIAIHIAAAGNSVEVVRTLLEHGCHPDMVRNEDVVMSKDLHYRFFVLLLSHSILQLAFR